MADEILLNQRIDQLDLGTPQVGDFGIFRDMAAAKTKRYLLPIGVTSANFEWVSDNDPGYGLNEVVTYGGNWYQSQIANNLNIIPGTDATKWLLLTKSQSGDWWKAGVYSEDRPWVLSEHNGYPEILLLRSATRPYSSADIAAEEAAGDWISITQLLKDKITDSSGVISVLDFLYTAKKAFTLDTPIAAAHEMQISNADDGKEFEIYFEISALPAPITFPASFVMPDGLFNNATKVWGPLDIGTYYGRGVKIGAVWVLKLERINL